MLPMSSSGDFDHPKTKFALLNGDEPDYQSISFEKRIPQTVSHHDAPNSISGKKQVFVISHNIVLLILVGTAANFYLSIEDTLKYIFSWDALYFQMIAMLGFVGFFVGFLPSLWILDRYSTRVYIWYASFSAVICTALLCFKSYPAVTYLTPISMCLIYISVTGTMFYSGDFAEEFFSEHHQKFVISAVMALPMLGQTITFTLAAVAIPSPHHSDASRAAMKTDIFRVNYVMFALSILCAFGNFFYPKTPLRTRIPRAMSMMTGDSIASRLYERSSSVRIPGFRYAVLETKQLFRNPFYWFLVARYVFSSVNFTLFAVWPLYLSTIKGLSQSLVGKLIAGASPAGVVLTVVLGEVLDLVPRRLFTWILFALGVPFALGSLGILFFVNQTLVCISVFLIIVSGAASFALSYALTIDHFPQSDTLILGWMTLSYMSLSVIFYIVTAITKGSLAWLGWYQAVSSVLGLGLTGSYVFIERKSRRNFDDQSYDNEA